MRNLLLGWLAAQGITLANDAPDQAIVAAVQKRTADAQASALANDDTAGRITALENDLSTAQTALTHEQTARLAERRGRAEALSDLAIQKGIKTIAEREDTVKALANAADFDAEAKTLLATLPKVKTTDNAQSGKVLANEADKPMAVYAREFAVALANCGQDAAKAHAEVMKNHPNLFPKT